MSPCHLSCASGGQSTSARTAHQGQARLLWAVAAHQGTQQNLSASNATLAILHKKKRDVAAFGRAHDALAAVRVGCKDAQAQF
ncbi:uncharacterized protein MEPE_02291 [Melanopsichium pennsylvanicum]|uniref:Uncharacterized protein n=1 Tax=Melanopsichium pennsylvanicum TaxID=63383 RepID=A0AAJ4XJM3_9BASI|nr:uncharacterized protein MEPE_02291 [Melanopsichium pennsylvanicum]